ncbi:MAG: acyl-CoA thioesterase [Candidatus Aminicenantes bacterium]|nr:acyl-CoA thioesterase [Candidatus Aminicenantes bacterium]
MKKSQNSENFSPELPFSSSPQTTIEIKECVRYSETDQMGVAHNKNYFEWFEIGRTEFCRQKGIPYKKIEDRGFFLVVVEAFCRYKRALRYDDTFFIQVTLQEITSKKVVFSYQILSENKKQIMAKGYTTHIVTNAKTIVCKFPDDIIQKLKN